MIDSFLQIIRERLGKKKAAKLPTSEADICDFFFRTGQCPDCGNNTWMKGPRGSVLTSIKCTRCESYFEVSVPLTTFKRHTPSWKW
jgi:hypothetical protein